MASEQVGELADGELCLAHDRPECAGRTLAMKRHDHRPPETITKPHVAATLAHDIEPSALKGSNCVGSRDDRKPGTHAAISTEAMTTGSAPLGRGVSSKYSSKASRRFTSASSTVAP